MPSFENWWMRPRSAGTVRILSGFRSAGKTTLVRAAIPAVEAAAPSIRTVYIDLESPDYQVMRTAERMWTYIAGACPKGRFRLVLDEPGLFGDLIRLLKLVRESGRCASVLLVCSNAWRFAELEAAYPVVRYQVAEDAAPTLSPEKLEATWYKVLVRDVISPGSCVNGADVWHLGAWLFEHCGEVTSLRKIAAALSQYGSHVSHPTVDSYLKALQNAFLVERVECRDLFDGSPARTGFRLAIRHPKLFVQAFSVDRIAMKEAISWNDAYLDLRRGHDAVYYPKCGHADFVTFASDGKPVCWLVKGGKPVLRDR